MKIWENCIPEVYSKTNGPENLKVETELKVDEDNKGPIFCTVKWKKPSRRRGRRQSQNNEKTEHQHV